MKKLIITAMCVCLTIAANAKDSEIPGTGGIPDLTKGGTLTRVNLRWAGPVGVNIGSWRPRRQKIEDVRQFQVLEIQKGSPADGSLEIDDVILGADGTGAGKVPLFKGASSSMMEIGDAITEAEAHNPALLKLLVWRPAKKAPDDEKRKSASVGLRDVQKLLKPYTEGKTGIVTIKLESLGRYSDTAPYNCEKSKNILRKGIKKLYESNNPGKFSMGILCLMASDDPTSPDNDKVQARAKEWVYKMLADERGWGAWDGGVKLIILSEYYMKTKDETVFPNLIKRAEHHARGVSWFGTTGHKFADPQPDGSPSGRLSGYGPINCSGIQGFLGLSLACKAGVKSPTVDAAVKRQRIFFGHWGLRSGIGYGEMPYSLDAGGGDANGKHAMNGLALGLQEGMEKKAKFFTALTTLSTVGSRQYAHGGPFFGQVWQPVGAAQGGVKAAHLQFNEIRWHMDLKRSWDDSFIFDPTNNKYSGFSYPTHSLMFYALPLKNLYVTGRGQKDSLRFTDEEFKSILAVKNFDASKATSQELIESMGKSFGLFRSAASIELAARLKAKPDDPESTATMDTLLALVVDTTASPQTRTGICKTLQRLKGKSGDPNSPIDQRIVKTMVSLLKDPDAYIRFGGVRVMQAFHRNFSTVAIKPYANEIMDAIIATDRPTFPLDEEDPAQWAHGEMGAFLFGTVLSKDLDGVDRKKLLLAIRSSLNTPNGGGRHHASKVLGKLTMEEVREIGDVLANNIKFPPPANAMGGSAAPQCQSALATHLFEEALPLSLTYGGSHAIKNKIPEKYGSAAFAMESSKDLIKSLGKLMLLDASIDARKVIEQMQNTAAPEMLYKLKRIDAAKAANSTLTLPAAKTELVVDATNYGCSVKETTYTWRKVYGAGKVEFAPNASSGSKITTVSFTDQKPGKYRFEVTMSDTLGYNVLTKTVDVTLFDKRGKLPANEPPKAKSAGYRAVSGLPLHFTLTGSDPDGDDLSFVVIEDPQHGTLEGVGGDLTYTADFGFNGIDRLAFAVIDGQCQHAKGTVGFKVSDKDVGVVVYEGFDYATGPIHGTGGDPSFGFSGAWTNTRATKDFYLVDREPLGDPNGSASLSYTSLPSTGGMLKKGKGWWPLSRPLDTKLLADHKLLENGHELWFSLYVSNPKSSTYFELTGPEIRFGLAIDSRKRELRTTLNGESAGESNIAYSRSTHLRYVEGPNMIIGHCVWGQTDEDLDTVKLYKVFDSPDYGPLVLETPARIMKAVIPQAKINHIFIKDFEHGAIDEIRIGTTLNSVMLGTKPLSN